MDQFYPETAKNVVKILDAASIDVYYNPEQTCCGRYAFTSGFVDEAKEIGEKFIKDFPNDRPIVGVSARTEDRHSHPRTVSFPIRDATKRKIETVHF